MSVLLAVAELRARYGEAEVLKGISFDIQPGEIVALVGSNGVGKTTLLRSLSRLIPISGRIEFAGRPLPATPDAVFASGLVQVPEGRQLFDRMSVEDNLLMGAYRREGGPTVQADLARVYELFPILKDRRKQLAGSMSGGEQQMCALARGLMAAPKLLLVDEMSLGLAPVIVERLLDILTTIREQGVTAFMAEQDVHSALSIADRAYVLAQGQVVLQGSAAELLHDPEVQRAYLGF